jgi:hypothetical protein
MKESQGIARRRISRLLIALAIMTPLALTAVMLFQGARVGHAQFAPTPAPFAATPPNGLPQLMPAPGIPGLSQASASPTPRVFNCSCRQAPGPAQLPSFAGTIWMGRVQASSFFMARQTAAGQCLQAFNNKTTQSAFIPPRVSSFLPATPLGTLPTPVVQLCGSCACD